MKYITLLLILLLVLTGCQASGDTTSEQPIAVVASLFPQYDFARIVGGDQVSVSLLLPPGVEAHSYEPTPKEVVAIESSDLFLYTGEHMEPWAHRLIGNNRKVNALDLSERIESIEGDCDCDDHSAHDHADAHESDEAHSHADATDHDHDHGGVDPHIWTDPVNAIRMVESITQSLQAIAPEKKDYFQQNADAYIEKLKALDQDFKDLFDRVDQHDIFFAGHNAFGYFAQRYGLHFHTPYAGYSPDAEPSPRSITELMDKMEQSGSKVIYYEELIEPKVARVIQEATGAEMRLLNAAHNVSKEVLAEGVGYLDIMQANLKTLSEGMK